MGSQSIVLSACLIGKLLRAGPSLLFVLCIAVWTVSAFNNLVLFGEYKQFLILSNDLREERLSTVNTVFCKKLPLCNRSGYMLLCAVQMSWRKSKYHCLVYFHSLWRVMTFGEVCWSSWGLAFCAAFLHRMVIYGFKQTRLSQIPLIYAPGGHPPTLGSCKNIMATNDNCWLPLNLPPVQMSH